MKRNNFHIKLLTHLFGLMLALSSISSVCAATGASLANCKKLATIKEWKGTYTLSGKADFGWSHTTSEGLFTYDDHFTSAFSAQMTIPNTGFFALLCPMLPNDFSIDSTASFNSATATATGHKHHTWPPGIANATTNASSVQDWVANNSTPVLGDMASTAASVTFSLSNNKITITRPEVGYLEATVTDYDTAMESAGVHQPMVSQNSISLGRAYSYDPIIVDLPTASASSMAIRGSRTFKDDPSWNSPSSEYPGGKTGNWTETWELLPVYLDGSTEKPRQELENPCLHSGSIVGCENRSLGEVVGVAGTPYRLHYQSDRVTGSTGVNTVAAAYALDLGGWTLDVHHRYDPVANLLFLGTGGFRGSASLGTVTASASSGFLIASEDGQRVFEFDSNGVHLNTRNALTGAALLTFAYDGAGHLTSITDGSGNLTSFSRSTSTATLGRLTAITGPYGQISVVTLSKEGYLTSIKDPAGKSVKAKYSKTGLMTSFTNIRGSSSTFTYDTSGLLVIDKNAIGGSQTLTTNGDAVTHVSAMGHVTSYQTVTQSDGSIDRTVTLPSMLTNTSHKTALLADTVTTADGMLTASTPVADSRFGNSASVVQTYTATTPGNLVNTLSATRTVTLSGADPFSLTQQTETLTRNGHTHTSRYAAASSTFTDTSAVGRTSTRTINNLGRTTSSQISGLNAVNYSYDTRGRLQSASMGSGANARTTRYTYDSNGYLASVTDALGNLLSYTNDKLGHPLQTSLPDGSLLKLAYDSDGNITKLTDQSGKSYGLVYGKTGQLSRFTLPASKGAKTKQSYTYNKEDQLTGMIRLDGTKLAYTYDTAGRLSSLSAGTGAQAKTWTYGYDATHGQLSSVASPEGISLGFIHDGELLQSMNWTGPITGNVGFTYNNDFQIASVSVNGANPISYAYDADGLLTAAGPMTLQRNPQNGLLTGSMLSDVEDAITSNQGFGEVDSYEANSTLAGSLMAVDYSYDKGGRITELTEALQGGNAKTYQYSYEAKTGRLQAVSDGTTTTTYGYDKNGNRTSANTTGGNNVIGSYDAQNRLLTYGDIKYGYNNNGEVSSRSLGNDTTQLTYNALGNLVAAKLPDGTQIDYVVDGAGMRIGRKKGGALQQAFLFQDSLRPVAELDGSGNVVSRFVYATRINVPDYMLKGAITYRILTDHLGSPRLVVNASDGSVVQRIDYDEFGNVLNDSNPGFQPFGFAGGLYDQDTKLLHFGAREYDPKTGRWLSLDPIGFKGGSINLYEYSGNDPVNKIDPTGLNEFLDTLSEIGSQLVNGGSKFVDEAKDIIKDAIKDIINQETEVTPPSPGKEVEKLQSEAVDRANDSVIPFYDDLRSVWDKAINALSGEDGESCPPKAKKPSKKKFPDPMKNPNNFRTPPELNY